MSFAKLMLFGSTSMDYVDLDEFSQNEMYRLSCNDGFLMSVNIRVVSPAILYRVYVSLNKP